MPDNDLQTIINETFRRLNEASRRLRTLEERFSLIETNLSNESDAIIRNRSESISSLEKISLQVKNLDERLLVIENEISRIGKILEKTAKRTELEEVRGMVSLLNPMSSKFVTEGEVRRIISSGSKKEE